MLLSLPLPTFPLYLPNSLPKEKGTSNTPLSLQSPTFTNLVWITQGKKKDLQAQTTTEKDTSEMEEVLCSVHFWSK